MSDADWKLTLKNGPLENQTSVRFDLPSVPISLIAKQFYCEKQIEYENTIGKVTSDEELRGTDIHDDLIDSKCEFVDIEEIIESIENETYCPCVIPLWFQVNDMSIKGMPDLVVFQNSKPVLLVELKSTSGSLNHTYQNQKVQCESYGFALEEMGFNCKDLMLAIVLVDSWTWDLLLKDDFFSSYDIEEILTSARDRNIGVTNKFEPLSEDENYEVMWHLKKYNREDVVDNISWAADYWLMKREAVFADRYSKCRYCPYKGECPKPSQHSSRDFKEIRKEYPNAYKKWTENDEIRLRNGYEEGKSIDELAKVFLRKPGAIQSRLRKLGLIED